jgi:4-diphosphocytidyl-2-C-methyl-D-erythritol kinase
VRVERIAPHVARVRPFAKLNLFLEVLFERGDGYHEIESLMQAIDLRDELTVEQLPGSSAGRIDLAIGGDYVAPADPTNLVVRAAEAYFSAVKQPRGLKVNLRKSIPPGAGLGGGSSDAAGMLTLLNTLDDSRLAPEELSELAATLGSDVPFFLHGGTAVARGRGERIEPLEDGTIPPYGFVLLYPRVTSPTPDIYRTLKSCLTTDKRDLHRLLADLVQGRDRRSPPFYNALSAPFRRVFPAIAALMDRVSEALARPFHVSGSGSTLFTVVEGERDGEDVLRRLQAMAAGDTFLCRSLLRREESSAASA